MTSPKKGSKKIGRAARKPAHNRYNSERRWEKNKLRKIEKEKKRQARLAKRVKKGGFIYATPN